MRTASTLMTLAATCGLIATLLGCGGQDEPDVVVLDSTTTPTGSAAPSSGTPSSGATGVTSTDATTESTSPTASGGTPQGGTATDTTTTATPTGSEPAAGSGTSTETTDTGGQPAVPPGAGDTSTTTDDTAVPDTSTDDAMGMDMTGTEATDDQSAIDTPDEMGSTDDTSATDDSVDQMDMVTEESMMEEEMMEEEMPDVDQNGKMNAMPGESTSTAQDYLRLGDIRILNNNWGSAELGCSGSTMSVFVQEDRVFGWEFNRPACGGGGSQPDFPQIEFGIHPFGIGDELVTSPEFSSTTVLPKQIKDIQSASISIDNLNIALQNQQAWNITMEFWLSERDPVNDPNPGVYAEIMAFWGWQNMRWPCDMGGSRVEAGMGYTLCHQVNDWADGKWRYFQFRAGDGSDGNIRTSFSGTIDIKPFLDFVVNNHGYSQDLWVTRLEVGSEIDDNTSGRVTLSNITFEVNGESRSPVFGDQ